MYRPLLEIQRKEGNPGGVKAPKNPQEVIYTRLPLDVICCHPSRVRMYLNNRFRYPGLRFALPWAKTLPPLRGSWKRNIPFGMIYCRVGSNIQQLRLARSISAPSTRTKQKKPLSDFSEGGLNKEGGYLLSRLRSTIGVTGLNFSVRNGKRWNPGAITTKIS